MLTNVFFFFTIMSIFRAKIRIVRRQSRVIITPPESGGRRVEHLHCRARARIANT